MQILFECTNTLTTQQKLKLIENTTIRRKRWLYFAILLLGIALIALAATPPVNYSNLAVNGACTVIIAYGLVSLPIKNLRHLNKFNESTYGTDDPVVHLKFGEYIEQNTSGASGILNYSDVLKVYIFDDMIALLVANNSYVVVVDTNFTKGNYDQLKEFIAAQCKNAQYYETSKFILPIAKKIDKEMFANEY